MIKREISQTIDNHIRNNKILVLQATKHTQALDLVLDLISNKEESLVFDLEDKKTNQLFKTIDASAFENLIGKQKYILLNEAQLCNNLQFLLEYILFGDKNINLICICSYEPLLDDVLREVLEQNQLIINVQAPSFKELANHQGLIQFEKQLEERLIFGNYPEIIDSVENAFTFLTNCSLEISNYSFGKTERVNKKEKFKKMLHFIAFNIGEQLSYNQIGTKCGLDNETVERYVLMLEKAFILIKLPVFSSEKRYELNKAHCFYFYDNGIRNAFVQNFNPLEYRNDVNQLWKNWLIAEKMKKLNGSKHLNSAHFWLTHTKQKIDFILQNKQEMKAYQLLWEKDDKFKIPSLFKSYYPESLTYKINRASYWSFLSKD